MFSTSVLKLTQNLAPKPDPKHGPNANDGEICPGDKVAQPPHLQTRPPTDNSFLSESAMLAFNIIGADLSHLSKNITSACLLEGINTPYSVAQSAEIANDGVIRILRPPREQNDKYYTAIVDVPGLDLLGRAEIDRESGTIMGFHSFTDPMVASKILLRSPSNIAQDIIRLLDCGSITDSTLPERVELVSQINEDQGIVVDSHGNAIVFSLDSKLPDRGTRIIAVRSKIEAIQTGGLETCCSFLGLGKTFGFLFHATSVQTFRILASTLGDYLKNIPGYTESPTAWVVRNSHLAFEFGDPADDVRYCAEANNFLREHLHSETPARYFNSSDCSMHLGLRKIARSCMETLPRRQTT